MRRAWVALAASSLLGCGTAVTYTSTDDTVGTLPSRPVGDVQVFMAGPPSRPYKEIGFVEARQQSAYASSDPTAMVDSLREQAAERGCDGVIVQGADTQSGSGFVSNGTGAMAVGTLRGYRGVCIVFQSGGAMSGQPRVAPEGAVGYRFGDSAELAKKGCLNAGGSWTASADGADCDRIPAGVGFAAKARLSFCGGQLCVIEVVAPFVEPTEEVLLKRWHNAKHLLEGRYDAASSGHVAQPPACIGRLAECIGSKQAEFRLVWDWNEGTRVVLSMDGATSDIVLRIRYAGPTTRESSAAQGL